MSYKFSRIWLVVLVAPVPGMVLAADPAGFGQKPGLWHIQKTMTFTAQPAYPPSLEDEKMCIGAATTDQMVLGLVHAVDYPKVVCSKHDIRLRRDGATVDFECSLNGKAVAITHGEITEPSSEAFHEVAQWDHLDDGGKAGGTYDGQWLGDCPAGMKSGDVVQAPTSSTP